jgi:hypothetical protein
MSEIITETLSFLIENAPSSEYLEKLEELIRVYKQQDKKINTTKQIDQDIKEKILTTFNFINFVKTICKTSHPCIFGSFPRMMFERCFNGLYELDGYGNTINHDIDIYIYEEKYDFNTSDFNTLIKILSLMKSNMTFGNYKIHSIHDKTINISSRVIENAKDRMLDIPHYVIMLQNGDKFIKYDLLGYKIESTHTWTNEFNINSLNISKRGIHCEESFCDTIINIMNKTADCTIDFKKLINPLTKSGMRIDKVKIFNDLIYFSCMRTKILSLGYTQIYNEQFGNIILTIEKEEDCPITSLKAPYIQMELECGHLCSIMALAGIINVRSSNDTESISCPFCRHTMIPKLDFTKNTNKLSNYNTNDNNLPLPTIPPYEIGQEIITQENREYVNGLLYGLTPQQIMSGRFPVYEYQLLRQ